MRPSTASTAPARLWRSTPADYFRRWCPMAPVAPLSSSIIRFLSGTATLTEAILAQQSLRHFIDMSDFSSAELRHILDVAVTIKQKRQRGLPAAVRPLKGKTLAMIFDKPSTRTRISFDLGMRELGGETMMLTGAEMQLGRGESTFDTAQVMSRYVDIIVIRTLDHQMVTEMAEYATVPVINALTKLSHPCQIMADVMTFEEHRGPIAGKKIAWVGDSSNVATSLVHAAVRFNFAMTIATPPAFAPRADLLEWAQKQGADVRWMVDATEAVKDAHAVFTDCWVSMGDEEETYRRQRLLAPYQVNTALMGKAKSEAVFLHCLPAHRGEEVTDEVMDGPQSIVFDEAENRLHAQKGILAWCLNADNAWK